MGCCCVLASRLTFNRLVTRVSPALNARGGGGAGTAGRSPTSSSTPDSLLEFQGEVSQEAEGPCLSPADIAPWGCVDELTGAATAHQLGDAPGSPTCCDLCQQQGGTESSLSGRLSPPAWDRARSLASRLHPCLPGLPSRDGGPPPRGPAVTVAAAAQPRACCLLSRTPSLCQGLWH